MVGVLVGGFVSRETALAVERARERDRRLQLGCSVFFKAMQMADSIAKLREWVSDCLPDEDGTSLWRRLRPVYGVYTQEIEYLPEELALFVTPDPPTLLDRLTLRRPDRRKSTDDRCSTQLLELAGSYRFISEASDQYRQHRDALHNELEERGFLRMDGETATIVVPPEHAGRYQLRFATVEHLARVLIESIREGAERSEKLIASLGDKLSERLKDRRFALTVEVRSSTGYF